MKRTFPWHPRRVSTRAWRRLSSECSLARIRLRRSNWEASDISAHYAILRCSYSESEALAEIILNEAIRANLACYDLQEDIALFPCDPDDAERALEGLEVAEQICMKALRSVFRPKGDDAPIGLEFVSD